MVFFPTTEQEVLSAIMNLEISKAHDIDDLQIKPIRYAIDLVVSVVEYIYNLCFESGTFPASVQIAKITVLFKGGDKNCLANYRPLSIFPIFSKGLEKIMHDRLAKFIGKHSLLSNSQFGFRKRRSLEIALLAQKEFIANALN